MPDAAQSGLDVAANPMNIAVLTGVCHDCCMGEHWECDDRNIEAEANGEETDCPCYQAKHGRSA